jgi:hypothetical protein
MKVVFVLLLVAFAQPSAPPAADKHILSNHSRGLGVELVVQNTTIRPGDDVNFRVYVKNEGTSTREVICRSPQANERFIIYDATGSLLKPEHALGETSNNGPLSLQPGQRTPCDGPSWTRLSQFGYRLSGPGTYKVTALRTDIGDDEAVYGIESNTVSVTVTP